MEKESNLKVLTCLIRDDVSSFFLLYRKLLSTKYDLIGIQTAYDRKNQKFYLTQPVTKHFQRIACLGPTPIYEDYVPMANFPSNIDLNNYQDNVVTIDLIEHLRSTHIDDIYPNQKTVYKPNMLIDQELFAKTQHEMNIGDKLNICINIFDPLYDPDLMIIYDVVYSVAELGEKLNKKINLFNMGAIHREFGEKLLGKVEEEFEQIEGINIINFAPKSLTEQIAVLLKSDFFISGSYGLGFMAYSMSIPSMVIFPYIMSELMGKTIPKDVPDWYIEVSDLDPLEYLDKVVNITRKRYDWNRNSNT